jgi:hypothetical protein
MMSRAAAGLLVVLIMVAAVTIAGECAVTRIQDPSGWMRDSGVALGMRERWVRYAVGCPEVITISGASMTWEYSRGARVWFKQWDGLADPLPPMRGSDTVDTVLQADSLAALDLEQSEAPVDQAGARISTSSDRPRVWSFPGRVLAELPPRGKVTVRGYLRDNGAFVRPHTRRLPRK